MTRHPTQENHAMQLDIRGRRLTPALLDHVERRVRVAVRRLAAAPSRVAVRLDDDDTAAGKRCRIDFELPGGAFTIEEGGRDLFAAIDRATARAGATERFRAA
jgi:ribosome-associated translation inhibitor RaiA